MTLVAILDYGMGNLRSVEKALERVGTEAQITHEPDAIRESDGLILPASARFRARSRVCMSSGSTVSSPRGSKPERRCSGSASGFSSCSIRRSRTRAPRGSD